MKVIVKILFELHQGCVNCEETAKIVCHFGLIELFPQWKDWDLKKLDVDSRSSDQTAQMAVLSLVLHVL